MGCGASVPDVQAPSPVNEVTIAAVANTTAKTEKKKEEVPDALPKEQTLNVVPIKPIEKVASSKEDRSSSVEQCLQPTSARERHNCGVSLTFLSAFAEKLDKDWTTVDVVQKVIALETEKQKCSYANLLPAKQVGTPTHYIIHRWAATFCETVGNVLQYFKIQQERLLSTTQEFDDMYVWMDIFAIPQHAEEEHVDDFDVVRKALAVSGKTLLCLDNRGLILQRAWCLYEIHQTIVPPLGSKEAAYSKLQIVCGDVDAPAVNAMYQFIDLGSAKATVDYDCIRIKYQFGIGAKMAPINATIKRALAESAALEIRSVRHSSLQLVKALVKGVRLLRCFGRYVVAEDLMKEDLESLEQSIGTGKEARLQLGLLLLERGQVLRLLGVPKDKVAFEKKLMVSDRVPPIEHIRATVSLMMSAGDDGLRAFPKNMKNSSAEDLALWLHRVVSLVWYFGNSLIMAHEIFEDICGEKHVLPAEAKLHLGMAYLASNNTEAAISLIEESMKLLEAIVGSPHVLIVTALHGLAEAYLAASRLDEYERTSQRALQMTEEVYGEDHPYMANVLMLNGEQLRERNKDAEAEVVLLRAADLAARYMGPEHYLIGHVHHRLASVYISIENWPAVERSAQIALKIYQDYYPADHIFIAHARAKVGRALVAEKRWDAAREVLIPAMEVLKSQPADPFNTFCQWCMDQMPS